jgi:hypothetical protein
MPLKSHHRDPRATALDNARARPRTRGEARLALLHERGASLSDIARELGKNLSTVSRVNRGQRRSEAIEGEIARRLGLSAPEAFPEWGRSSGEPHAPRARRPSPARVQEGRRTPTRAALVTALILEHPMCLDCVVAKSGLGPADLDTTMAAVATALRLRHITDRCLACGTVTSVLSLERPAV